MEQSLQLVNNLLDQAFSYGVIWIYLTLFVAAFIENIFPPFPGDFFTLTAGAIAASGRMNVWIAFGTITCGGVASVLVIYFLGKNLGRDFFIRKNYRLISRDDIFKLEKWFNRRGAMLLLFNRFIVGARAAVALIAGMSRYNFGQMTVLMSISFLMFNGLVIFSGYLFVEKFDLITRYFHTYEKLAWPILIIVVILFIVYKIKTWKRDGK